MPTMPDDASRDQQVQFVVGSRVLTRARQQPDSTAKEAPLTPGTVVEDNCDLLSNQPVQYGREWAIPRRWTIALDDGGLAFRDDHEIEIEPPPSGS